MLPDQPTNQPTEGTPETVNDRYETVGDRYMSMRITTPHADLFKIVESVVHDVSQYIIYPHLGSNKKEHFHICIPIRDDDDAVKLCERYRKRAKSINGGGPGKIMCKTHSNGCECFVGYVKHEAGEVTLKGFSREWFDSIEKREVNIGTYLSQGEKKKSRNEDHFYQITYQNMERVTLRYRQQNGIKSTDLEDTLEHMHKNGWRLQVTVLRQGIPAQFYDEFKAKCKGETTFTSGRFARMRSLERWRDERYEGHIPVYGFSKTKAEADAGI